MGYSITAHLKSAKATREIRAFMEKEYKPWHVLMGVERGKAHGGEWN